MTHIQIEEIEELIGKTIKSIKDDMLYGCMGIVFTDGSYTVIQSGSIYDGDKESPELYAGDEFDNKKQLGLLTAEELAEEDRKAKERTAYLRKQLEEREKAEFERLKKKYANELD